MMRNKVIFFVGFFLATATLASAAGVVPCDGPGCRACDIVILGQNLLMWFIGIMASIIALMFAWGGMQMVMSAGNTGAVSAGKEKMTNAVIGLVIILGAWLIVDTVLKVVMGGNIGVWNKVECVANPSRTATPPPSLSATGGSGSVGSGTPYDTTRVASMYGAQIDKYCANSSIPKCKDVVVALITAESRGRTDVTSPKGAVGLMQLLPANGGVNCNSGDTTCVNGQIEKGIKMLENSYSNTSSIPRTLASYNGGSAAIQKSNCCPSGLAYECPYDCNNAKNYNQCTGVGGICTANVGFVETRNYVNNICSTIGGCD